MSGVQPPEGDLEFPLGPFPGLDAHIDQVIDGIEARLVDAVRAIVDERLPDIVREVIREEMEKIKAGQ